MTLDEGDFRFEFVVGMTCDGVGFEYLCGGREIVTFEYVEWYITLNVHQTLSVSLSLSLSLSLNVENG